MAAATASSSYYLVPRRSCHITLVLLALLFLGVPLLGYATAPRWLPAVPALLDAERPLDNPDVVVVKASGETDAAYREAVRLYQVGAVKQVVVLGLPFTPDRLAPPPRNRRVEQLVAAGLPRAAVVEVPGGDTLHQEMAALRQTADARGWRRILFLVDALGGRRNLIVADRYLSLGDRAVGQRVFPLGWFDARSWWHGGQSRTIVFVRAVQLAVAALGNRSS